MSVTFTEARNKRSWAKGSLTKVATQVKLMQAYETVDLDEELLRKQIESLVKADEVFQVNHQLMYELDESVTEQQFDGELAEHHSTLTKVKKGIRVLLNCCEVEDQVGILEDALEAMERATGNVHCVQDESELARAIQLVNKFRESRTRPGASGIERYKDIRDDALKRLKTIQLSQKHSKALSEPPKVTITKEVQRTSSNLKLPQFSGSMLTFHEFAGLFHDLISKEKGLTDNEKICHLLQSMSTPETKDFVESAMAYSDRTFDSVFQRLRDRYDRKRVVHALHLEELFMWKRTTFGNLRSQIDAENDHLERHTRGLERTGGYTAQQLTAARFESRMDETLLPHWKKFTADSDKIPTDDTLKLFFKTQREYAVDDTIPARAEDRPSPVKQKPPRQQPHRTVLATQPSPSKPPDKCQYCHSDHSLFHCVSFKQKDIRQRRDWAKAENLCFNCLGSGHRVGECYSKGRCRECRDKHHTLLHDKSNPDQFNDSAPGATINLANPHPSGHSSFSLPSTAVVTVKARGIVQKARAQLDSGATISLISRNLANTLKAKRLPNSGTEILGVGGSCRSPHQVEVILVGNGGEEIAAHLHVVEVIPPTESNADVSRIFNLPFLSGLDLSDPEYTSASRIDILLDMGLANSCSREGVKRAANRSLKAENTVFGWVVGGHDSVKIKGLFPSPVVLEFLQP